MVGVEKQGYINMGPVVNGYGAKAVWILANCYEILNGKELKKKKTHCGVLMNYACSLTKLHPCETWLNVCVCGFSVRNVVSATGELQRFSYLIVCNQRVLRDLSVHNEGGGSNFLTLMFFLIMWLKMLLCKKILSVQYSWDLGISMRWISIRLYVLQTMNVEITQRQHVLIPGTVCWCPVQWDDWSIIAQVCLTGEISLRLLQDKLPPLLGDTPWLDEIICMSSKAALPLHFSPAVTVHHGIPQADRLVMVGYNIGYPAVQA